MKRGVRAVCLAWLVVVLAVAEGAFESDELEWEAEEAPLPLPKELPTATTRAPGAAAQDSARAAGGAGAGDSGDAGVVFPLEHSLDGVTFTPAGEFSAKLRPVAGQAVPKLTRVRLARQPWSPAEQRAFVDLIARNGYYRLRVPAHVFSAAGPPYVVTAVRAACLADARFNEHFDLHVDTAGHVLALGYKTFVDCTKASGEPPREWTFSSTATVRSSLTAPRLAATLSSMDALKPPKAPKLPPRVEGGGSGKDGEAAGGEGDEEEEEEKTFFQKYWLYMIPAGLLLLNMMAAAAPDEAAQGASRR
ncbi:hypothetical protein KFL_004660110 [Klebsormidium nitens]|uniref:ER membrane protein complex subunit 10 n=1 Tax=Klebsormidium nitens TaxID=105231 RepID=A0A1Y1IHC0_KLENI|nr:hypothetical protein KFL_004660110 [Klebsormidium nitens]|eukprot:GAQ88879.1 hypothetical protein KFL_004660110 [Klebsormidium nitens]